MDRRRIEASARVLRQVTGALAGTSSVPTLGALDRCSEEPLRRAMEDPIAAGRTMHAAFDASMLIESVGAAHDLRGQFNIHSVWVRNGARGAVAVAAAIAVADVANVDHGF